MDEVTMIGLDLAKNIFQVVSAQPGMVLIGIDVPVTAFLMAV